MKISNSKKELARIISENGGWRGGAEWAAQDKKYAGQINLVVLYISKPPKPDVGGTCWGGMEANQVATIEHQWLISNWHQTILSRAEYFHLYPEPDADGWIEWNGGERPVDADAMVVCKVRSGKEWRNGKAIMAGILRWYHTGGMTDIIAYRLHRPVQAKPEPAQMEEAKPTIEQLAADYRNAKDYANLKQDEADKANMQSDAALSQLEDAIAAIGFAITPLAATKKEPELVITDWRDLMSDDVISIHCFDDVYSESKVIAVGCDDVLVRHHAGANRLVDLSKKHWEFIRRP